METAIIAHLMLKQVLGFYSVADIPGLVHEAVDNFVLFGLTSYQNGGNNSFFGRSEDFSRLPLEQYCELKEVYKLLVDHCNQWPRICRVNDRNPQDAIAQERPETSHARR